MAVELSAAALNVHEIRSLLFVPHPLSVVEPYSVDLAEGSRLMSCTVRVFKACGMALNNIRIECDLGLLKARYIDERNPVDGC